MEEEKKQELAPVEEPKQEPIQQSDSTDQDNTYALVTFIISCVGFVVCAGWIVGGIACFVLGFIALNRSKNFKTVRQPFKTFQRVAKPVAIFDIVIGFVSAIGYTIKLIIDIVDAIQKAAQ